MVKQLDDKKFSASKAVNVVTPLPNGQVHIKLGRPITQRKAQLWLMIMLGNRRGNRIHTNADKIVALKVWPECWVDVLEALGASRGQIQEFKRLSMCSSPSESAPAMRLNEKPETAEDISRGD